MYFVNRSDIEKRIHLIDQLIEQIDGDKLLTSDIEKLALERRIHVVIESILDVGNSMIDGFIMRDPGSYHDIIDILIDEQVLPKADESNYKEIIDLRQMIVQQYTNINHEHLAATLLENKDVIKKFSEHIRNYLENELGPAHAFSKE